MKLAAVSAAVLIGSAGAFTAPSMTISLGGGKKPSPKKPKKKVSAKKAAPVAKKAAPVAKKAPRASSGGSSNAKFAPSNSKEWDAPSVALPFGTAPPTLDGSLIGDVGFDPFGFSTSNRAPSWWPGTGTPEGNLKYLREAEITHGRICQLAVLGFIWPALVGTFPGNEWTGADAYSELNPFAAATAAPPLAWIQIVLAMGFVENIRSKTIKEKGEDRIPGDLRLGQGDESNWNPFNLQYTEEEYEKKQLQELKHCRLAMLGTLGLVLQAYNSGTNVIEQLGSAFTTPEYYAKAGYFLPEGI